MLIIKHIGEILKEMKIEFVKPIFHIDKYFEIADYLIQSENKSLSETGKTMKKVYSAQMLEKDSRKAEDNGNGNYNLLNNPAECRTGNCD